LALCQLGSLAVNLIERIIMAVKLLPWWLIIYWFKGPAITIHDRHTGKIVFTLFRGKINENLVKE
jgi:hypothetical protein